MFVPASVALIIVPGPDSLYVLTQSISGGQRNGLSSVLGICTGILVHTTAAVLGLSAILRTSSLAYTIIKYVGALYLLYLGIQTIRHKENFKFRADDAETATDNTDSYRRGVMLNTLESESRNFLPRILASVRCIRHWCVAQHATVGCSIHHAHSALHGNARDHIEPGQDRAHNSSTSY